MKSISSHPVQCSPGFSCVIHSLFCIHPTHIHVRFTIMSHNIADQSLELHSLRLLKTNSHKVALHILVIKNVGSMRLIPGSADSAHSLLQYGQCPGGLVPGYRLFTEVELTPGNGTIQPSFNLVGREPATFLEHHQRHHHPINSLFISQACPVTIHGQIGSRALEINGIPILLELRLIFLPVVSL